jgi:hypothetical protein
VLCSLWGTDWIIKYYLDELRLQRVKVANKRPVRNASSSFPLVPRWNIGPSQIFASGLHFCHSFRLLTRHFALVVLLRLLFQVTLGLPFLRFPCGFQSSPCLVMLFWPFLKVFPIHFHFLILISLLLGICCVVSHNSLLLIVFGHHIGTKCSTFKSLSTVSLITQRKAVSRSCSLVIVEGLK